MSMVDISPEALERIVRIETKLDMLVEMLPEIQAVGPGQIFCYHTLVPLITLYGLLSNSRGLILQLSD